MDNKTQQAAQAMIEYDVLNRFTGKVQFTAKIDCEDSTPKSIKLGLAVKWAIENNADLSDANLRYADLRYADLRGTNLCRADLRDADLLGADLLGADLRHANLLGADLYGANLRGANLCYANLRGTKNVIIPVTIGQVGEEIRTGFAIYTDDGIMVRLGCFYGTEKEAIDAVSKKYGSRSGYAMTVKAACKVAKERGILNPTEDNND